MSEERITPEQETERLLTEAEALIWGLLDENIDTVSMERLEKLLENEQVRQRYVQCVELHSDLQYLFQPEVPAADNKQVKPATPVLGSLGDLFKLPGLNTGVDETPLTD